MVLDRKRKKTEKPGESIAAAQPEPEQGLEAVNNEHKEREGRRGRKKGKNGRKPGFFESSLASCERETQKFRQEGEL